MESPEHAQLVEKLRQLLGRAESLVTDTIAALRIVPTSDRPAVGRFRTESSYAAIKDLATWFQTVHELLVYLPREPVLPELVYCLSRSAGDIYRKVDPLVILGSVFGVTELDLYRALEIRIPDISKVFETEPGPHKVILQLPICDRVNPSAWSILAHEVGHAVDGIVSTSSSLVEKYIKTQGTLYQLYSKWCIEILSDLIASRIAGPAAMLSLLNLEYCIFPAAPQGIHEISSEIDGDPHPLTLWRLRCVRDYFEHCGLNDYLAADASVYENLFRLSFLIHNDFDERAYAQHRSDTNEGYNAAIAPLTVGLFDFVDRLGLPNLSIEKSSLDRCLQRLAVERPISAQGLPRKVLAERIATYRTTGAPGERRVDSFSKLLREFDEQPVNIPTLLLSHQLRRTELMSRIPSDRSASYRSFLFELDSLNQVVIMSIRSAGICEEVIKKAQVNRG